LNFVSIDRYRRLGIVFLFNSSTKQFHYDGKVWKELTTRFATTNEAVEAQKRLDSLEAKMANKPVR
jgi:chromosome condensin MukBEF MukE localization factor